jgi:PAS domain S-box-containing protein
MLARYALGAAAATIAVAGHWLMFPYTRNHIPFLLFLPAMIFATVAAGRGPGYLVLLAGAVNASVQLSPAGSLYITDGVERIALVAYVLTGLFLVLVGYRLRASSRREYDDLHALHELSAALASIADSNEQLRLILQTLARMHGAHQGLVSLYDPASRSLRVAASLGFSADALAKLNAVAGGEGACGLACLERRRIVVEDVNEAPCFAPFRDLARQESFRAVHSTPIMSRDGQILGAISVHFPVPRTPTRRETDLADICARKAAVAVERAVAEDLAKQRERRFRTVLEASTVPFNILDPLRNESGAITDFRWIYVNAAASRILGHAAEGLVGRRVSEVLPGSWDEPGLLQMYASVVDEQKPAEREMRSQTNGIRGWFHITASPLDGMIAVWFADITERKRQEEFLREADRRKDEFLATLAHELRNPLAPIRQAAAIGQSERASDSQKRWGYSVIERQVQQMSLLLDDLLDVSRITRGTLTLRKQVVELKDVIGAAVETARPLIDSRHHQLIVCVPDGLRLNADALRLSQIFSNLLTNAAKYTPSGGTIRLDAEARDSRLIVRVEDTGVGLREEDLPRLFQMFAQGKTSLEHSQDGLGIGLALTKGLVEMHSGTIEARSAGLGRGSAFTVSLPRGEAAHSASATGNEEREPHLVVSRRVLIADDNRDAAESLAMLLRLEGHEVVLAHDGEDAIQLFEKTAPAVALLDIGMPKMNGYQVARRIRASAGGAHVVLIAVTGWGQQKDRSESREAGFDHHLIKPVEPEAVLRLIRPSSKTLSAAR